ncbi:DinB family protein [Metabacillus arenae]|uniref:DinB family protein n=1 Tax=Metabacillus arenae TaxID=2771434 RepID=A0A926NRD9_9BACI|nr:DinB family protein [Metabacillus arenae]MBD1382521.1 DinB family protein [Metabacillus arenae]
MLSKPNDNEFAPYYEEYINMVPEGGLLEILNDSLAETISLFKGISEQKSMYQYAPDKWTIKEVLGHMTDTEIIMCYRLLRIGRGDATPLTGFDEDTYVKAACFNDRTLENLLDSFIITRQATLNLIKSLRSGDWVNTGTANEQIATPRAIAYIIAGHEMHHRKILEERYLRRA